MRSISRPTEQALIDAWGGPLTATVTCQVLPPGFAGYERYCPWTVDQAANGNWLGPDLGRARALIDQAGVRGTAVTVLGGDDGGQHVAVARYFTDLLDSLGFRATTRLMGFDDYFTFLGEHPDQVQMAGYWVRAEDRAPATLIVGGFTCPSFRTAIERYPVGWCSPALDDRMTKALGLADTDPVGADAAVGRDRSRDRRREPGRHALQHHRCDAAVEPGRRVRGQPRDAPV